MVNLENWPQSLGLPLPLMTLSLCLPHLGFQFLRNKEIFHQLRMCCVVLTSSVGSISSQPSGGGLRLLRTLGITGLEQQSNYATSLKLTNITSSCKKLDFLFSYWTVNCALFSSLDYTDAVTSLLDCLSLPSSTFSLFRK